MHPLDGRTSRVKRLEHTGGRLKRIIILPFLILIFLGFSVTWLIYLSGSRAAIRGAVSSIIRVTSERVTSDAINRLASARLAASSNAALFAYELHGTSLNPESIQRYFLQQLQLYPNIAIFAVGLEDGEYIEAQRLADGTFRVAASGQATGGALAFRPVTASGEFLDINLVRPDYDPRKRPWYKTATQSGSAVWTEPYALYSNDDPAMAAVMTIRSPEGHIKGVATATLTLGSLSDVLFDYRESAQGIIYVVDRMGHMIASSSGSESLADEEGQRARAVQHGNQLIATTAVAAGLPRPGDPPLDSMADPVEFSFDMDRVRYLGLRLPYWDALGLDWIIVTALRESAFTGKLAEADRQTMSLLLAVLAASSAIGWWVVGYLMKPLRVLADGADMLKPGVAASPALTQLALRPDELGRLSCSFLAMKTRMDESFGALESSLREKEILLKEVHHRVKNNLQIVSSILSLQSGSLEDESVRDAFDECQDRIQAMALVHEEVYRTGSFESLDMGPYLVTICETLRLGRSDMRSIEIEARTPDAAVLPLDRAIPLGLIVNELVTNAIKHAFPGARCGAILVRFERSGQGWLLNVEDNGTGIPTLPERKEGVGTQLVYGLVEQLKGSIEYALSADGGTSVIIRL